MERVTLRMPEEQLERIENTVEESNKYANRSEAIRDAVSELVSDDEDEEAAKPKPFA